MHVEIERGFTSAPLDVLADARRQIQAIAAGPGYPKFRRLNGPFDPGEHNVWHAIYLGGRPSIDSKYCGPELFSLLLFSEYRTPIDVSPESIIAHITGQVSTSIVSGADYGEYELEEISVRVVGVTVLTNSLEFQFASTDAALCEELRDQWEETYQLKIREAS